ncbi:MAG: alpha-amylase family glycosyl hydrolase [Candidatus Saccharibacteria bacterium]|nr:alpha-amylase family glycosyl hydrolase [Candidatus Saccharibacteria bacterium]
MAKHRLIYQIYPSAIGDLRDIAAKIPLIAAKIQPDYIWLSPIFESPWIDGGYDVSDYCKIDRRFGTMNDFRHLVAVAKKYKIGILLDLVINHTSIDHTWFKKSELHDSWYKDYYVWLEKPLNWKSFFGGPAFDYSALRDKYYLHLYDRAQPDLNFKNPRVIKEFKNIIDFWKKEGIAGFRVDSANILAENNFRMGRIPGLPGFFSYYQTKDTVAILEKLLANKGLFTIAEPVGGELYSKRKFHELTNKAFDASFNVGTLDVADSLFSIKDRVYPVNYRRWFKKLSKWAPEPAFSMAIESHDAPRAPSRFDVNPRVLAMLQFLLPSYNPCIYQGQELGTLNADLSMNINDYPGVQSRQVYRRLRREGKTKRQAMSVVRRTSRDNARQPIDWGEYILQHRHHDSVLNFYSEIIQLWRSDPVIKDGSLKVVRIKKNGVFDFYRKLGKKKYFVHLDFSGKTHSYLKDDHGDIVIIVK